MTHIVCFFGCDEKMQHLDVYVNGRWINTYICRMMGNKWVTVDIKVIMAGKIKHPSWVQSKRQRW